MAILKRPVIYEFWCFWPDQTSTTFTRPQRVVNVQMALKLSISTPNILVAKLVFTKLL